MQKLKITCIEHAPFEGPGCMLNWAAPHRLSRIRIWEGEDPGDLRDTDLLLLMGGPMGAYEDSGYPWLAREKQWIREMVERGQKVLGICLGAQLIAAALGGKVYPGAQKEIGWFPVFPAPGPAGPSALSEFFSTRPTVFHWHGDTFDLPPGAVHHVQSGACFQQLFSVGKTVIGIQFHPEITVADIGEMVRHGAVELEKEKDGPWVQGPESLVAGAIHAPAANQFLTRLLDWWMV
ncbi:MAG TPA: gamma-glutamyl-gamma-aminobutyrate hydrolase family protein [Chitinophagaceae bacterium]|nr:gamma-glutamyl-gamma-aminobutyrate hydrolase family protein [Chitinophagaceae bacterium]